MITREVVDRFLIPRFYELKMPATGNWIADLEIVADGYSGKGTTTIRGSHYTHQLVHGLRPTEGVPIRPLQEWAKAKFGVDDKEAKSIAFAVRESIRKKGTTWYQKGGSSLLEVLESPECVAYMQDRALHIVRFKLKEHLIRQTKAIFQ
ncbi:hypothetical protein [Elizabethkingia phage TCUEAP1]|nr:hypothetical protein [Elizabethkingia phage TCUEAP1]